MLSPVSPSQAAAQLLEYCRLKKGLSIAEIATALGYRSPNSIVRIAKRRAGDAACKKFLDLYFSAFPDLVQSSEHKKILFSPEPFWSQLLQGHLALSSSSTTLWSIDGHILGSIGQYYASQDVSSVSILLLNGLYRPLIADLAALLSLPDASINHCLTVPYKGESFAHTVILLMPLLFNERYHLTQYKAKSASISGFLYADVMIVCYQCQAKKHMDMICFTAHDKATLISLPQNSSLEQLGLSAILNTRHPICSRKDLEFQGNYPAFLQWCTKLEEIGTIRQIKEDVGIEQIPTPILGRALREGIAACACEPEHLLEIVPEMAQICNKRWNTWHFHRKEHIHIMRLSSLWQFVKTGFMCDHFWALRAFSISERIVILEGLKQAINSNHYRLLFMPDRYWQGPGEITCYGRAHLSVINRNTSYDLSGPHKELLFTNSKIALSFIHFFDEFLVPVCTTNAEASSILDKMLHALRIMQST